MAKVKKKEPDVTISIVLPVSTLEQIEKVRRERYSFVSGRSAIIRMLLHEAMEKAK